MSETPREYDASHRISADILADELAEHIRAMSKGQYLLLCAAIEMAGGSLVLNAGHFAREASRMPQRIEVESDSASITLRLPT